MLAREIERNPDLLLIGQPTRGVDIGAIEFIHQQIVALRDQGKAILLVSVELDEIMALSDRIAVMCAGRLVESAPRDVLFRNPVHPYTKALLSAVPEPDITRQLNLTALMEGRASNPAAWPVPFTVAPGTRARLIDLGEGHFVRADPEAGSLAEVA